MEFFTSCEILVPQEIWGISILVAGKTHVSRAFPIIHYMFIYIVIPDKKKKNKIIKYRTMKYRMIKYRMIKCRRERNDWNSLSKTLQTFCFVNRICLGSFRPARTGIVVRGITESPAFSPHKSKGIHYTWIRIPLKITI